MKEKPIRYREKAENNYVRSVSNNLTYCARCCAKAYGMTHDLSVFDS
jgi:hypothetical protein